MKKKILIIGSAVVIVIGITVGFIVIPMLITPPPDDGESGWSWPTFGWSTSTPEEQNMSSSVLDDMNFFIFRKQIEIDSISIIKNGYLVYEEYYKDSLPNPDRIFTVQVEPASMAPILLNDTQKHVLYSCTKSITSLLIGIALDYGFIDNISQTFFEFYPERWNSTYDARKLNITIEHLLRMEAGFLGEFAEIPYVTYGQDYLDHLLSMPLLYDPGTPYNNTWGSYSNAGTTLLSAIINKTTGRLTWDFAQEYLFDPIGIPRENLHWYEIDGLNTGSSGIYMYPQDMAKIGYLCLNNGTWNGTQIVSSQWIQRSQTDNPGPVPYGYLWWINSIQSPTYYFAGGSYGQKIIIVNEIDMVIVLTAHADSFQDQIIRDYIIASHFAAIT